MGLYPIIIYHNRIVVVENKRKDYKRWRLLTFLHACSRKASRVDYQNRPFIVQNQRSLPRRIQI